MKFVNLYGGLANQLFQYTYALWLDQKGEQVSLAQGFNNSKILHRPHVASICDTHELILPIIKLKERKVVALYINDVFRRKAGWNEEDIYLRPNKYKFHIGYFQNIKFWDELSQDRKEAVVSPFRSVEVNPDNIGFIHMRFGDYLSANTMKVMGDVSANYYIEAINRPELAHVKEFHVFSDDEIRAKKIISVLQMESRKEINLCSTKNALKTLTKMSSYQAAIIPNSTFSWWGSNVGNCKARVMPRNWNRKKSAYLYDHNSIVI